MLKSLAVGGFLYLFAAACIAQNPSKVARRPQRASLSDVTADQLVHNCQYLNDADASERHVLEQTVCVYYIRGFLDGYASGLEFAYGKELGFCLPTEATFGQFGKVIAKYGNDHPEELWMQAHILADKALTVAYPCALSSLPAASWPVHITPSRPRTSRPKSMLQRFGYGLNADVASCWLRCRRIRGPRAIPVDRGHRLCSHKTEPHKPLPTWASLNVNLPNGSN